MAGTLQTLKARSPATATPPFLPRHLKLQDAYFSCPVSRTYFSYPGSRTLGVARKSVAPISKTTVVIRASNSSQEDDGGKQLPQRKPGNWTQPLLKFASSNFLPLALIGGVALGLANPTPGCLADKYYLSKFSTFGIFIISGLTLRWDAIGAAAGAWQVGLFGLV